MTIMDKEQNVKIINSFIGRSKVYLSQKINLTDEIYNVYSSNRKASSVYRFSSSIVLLAIKEFLDKPYIHTLDDIMFNKYSKLGYKYPPKSIYFSIHFNDEENIKLFERFIEYCENSIKNINQLSKINKPISTMLRIVVSTYIMNMMKEIPEEEPKITEPHKYIPIEIKSIIKNFRTCIKCSGLYLESDSVPIKILLLKGIKEMLQDSIDHIDMLQKKIIETMVEIKK